MNLNAQTGMNPNFTVKEEASTLSECLKKEEKELGKVSDKSLNASILIRVFLR